MTRRLAARARALSPRYRRVTENCALSWCKGRLTRQTHPGERGSPANTRQGREPGKSSVGAQVVCLQKMRQAGEPAHSALADTYPPWPCPVREAFMHEVRFDGDRVQAHKVGSRRDLQPLCVPRTCASGSLPLCRSYGSVKPVYQRSWTEPVGSPTAKRGEVRCRFATLLSR